LQLFISKLFWIKYAAIGYRDTMLLMPAQTQSREHVASYLELVGRVERYLKDFPVFGALSHDVTVRQLGET